MKKASAAILVGMIITAGLVAFSMPAVADETATISAGSGETYTIAFNDANMISHPGIAAADEQININEGGDGAANELIYLGESNRQLRFSITLTGDPGEDVQITVQGTGVVSIGDDNGEEFDTGVTPTTFDVIFTINTALTGDVEQIYPLTVRIYETVNGNSANIGIGIYVSSIVHDDATSDDTRDTPHAYKRDQATGGGDYVKDNTAGGDFPFEAGDQFKEAFFDLNNNAFYAVKDTMMNLTAPTGFTLVKTYAKFIGTIAAAADEDLTWRLDVAANKAPGVYNGTVVLSYLRTIDAVDTLVTESARPIDYAVDFSFKDDDPMVDGDLYSPYQCFATSVNITDIGEGNATKQVDQVNLPYDTYEQSAFSDKKITVEVVIQNNGNTPIYNAEFVLDPTAWPFFRNPNFFWVSAGTLDYDNIAVRDVDLDVGASITFIIEVIVVKEIPIGEHRLPILYDGFYFNDGAIGGATGYDPINGVDGIVNGANDLEVLFSIVVTDGYLDCHVAAGGVTGAFDKDDIRSEDVTVTIVNDEEYNFIDVIATADFTGTPFYAPLIDTATGQPPAPAARNYIVEAYDANMFISQDWAAGGNLVVTFRVDTDPTMAPDRYPFSITLVAIIEESLVEVTSTVTAGVEFDFAGYGPEVRVTAFTADEIVPGEHFDLELTIQNVGDDRVRDVFVTIDDPDHDGTDEYPWDLESDFKTGQFDWADIYNQWSVVTAIEIPEGMFYTMESLDVDNIREIVEINLYMEGVYSTPDSTIQVIKIIDLAPGASTTTTFDMIADKDMVNGKPYVIDVRFTGDDEDGTDYAYTQEIEVMSSLPGDSYNPVELNWFGAGMKLLGLFLFFIIVIAILLMVYNRFKGEPKKEEEEFGFEEKPATNP